MMSTDINPDSTIVVTFFEDHAATTKREETLSLHDLCNLIRATTALSKTALPWLKLARFGSTTTDRGSLRHNANVIENTGAEGDYDGERVAFDAICQILLRAGVAAIVYTSPSHTEDAPRCRILAPFSRPYPPARRDQFMARLNGLLEGILSRESWTLSQSYYFGSVNQSPAHRVQLILGTPLDLMTALDDIAIGKPTPQRGNGADDQLEGTEAGGAEARVGVSDARLDGFRRSVLDNLRHQAIDGQKHDALLRTAITLGGIQADCGFSDAEAWRWMRGCLPDSVEDWVAAERTAAWGLAEGRARPIELEDREPLTSRRKPGNGAATAGQAYEPDDDGPAPESTSDQGVGQAAPPKGADEDTDAPWQKYLQTDETGRVIANLANTTLAIRQAPQLVGLVAYDEMLRHTFATRSLPGSRMAAIRSPRSLHDADVTAIQEWLQRHKLRHISKDVTHQAVELVAREHAFHPIRDYLTGLTWDGTPRLDTWLSVYLGAEQIPYTRSIGRWFLISMVVRIMRPGCKCDYMLVLEGPQGIGKSTACRILAGAWFSDTLPELDHGDQVRISMHLRGKWLLEIPEMSAIRKAEADALKAFLTQTEERYTPKYGRNEVIEPRQCVFVGTTNKAVYLRDETGGRRSWPTKVGVSRPINNTALAGDRDQLFAEAMAAFTSGEDWWPDSAFESEHSKPQQEQRFVHDAWESIIGDWLETPVPDDSRPSGVGPRASCTVAEVASAALNIEKARLGTIEQRRITAALERLGWVRGKRKSHTRPWVRST
jgi:predicted P-loop ATPase